MDYYQRREKKNLELIAAWVCAIKISIVLGLAYGIFRAAMWAVRLAVDELTVIAGL